MLFNHEEELWSTIVPLAKTKVAVGFKMSFVLPAYTCFFFFAVLVLKLPKRVILFVYLCMKVDSLIELKEHKDLSLAEEADRNWTEIRDQTYLFDRKKREVTAPVSTLFQFETLSVCLQMFFDQFLAQSVEYYDHQQS